MLAVDPRVLVPRPETEFVVEAALSLPEGARVVDVGTGSGAIALALKDERPDLAVLGTDISADALDVARGNAERLGLDVEFVARRPARRPRTRSTPSSPTRPTSPPATGCRPTSGFEPREALFGGADGLDVIRRLVKEAADVPFVALEVGAGQAAEVAALMEGREVEIVRDLAGHERVVVGREPVDLARRSSGVSVAVIGDRRNGVRRAGLDRDRARAAPPPGVGHPVRARVACRPTRSPAAPPSGSTARDARAGARRASRVREPRGRAARAVAFGAQPDGRPFLGTCAGFRARRARGRARTSLGRRGAPRIASTATAATCSIDRARCARCVGQTLDVAIVDPRHRARCSARPEHDRDRDYCRFGLDERHRDAARRAPGCTWSASTPPTAAPASCASPGTRSST